MLSGNLPLFSDFLQLPLNVVLFLLLNWWFFLYFEFLENWKKSILWYSRTLCFLRLSESWIHILESWTYPAQWCANKSIYLFCGIWIKITRLTEICVMFGHSEKYACCIRLVWTRERFFIPLKSIENFLKVLEAENDMKIQFV